VDKSSSIARTDIDVGVSREVPRLREQVFRDVSGVLRGDASDRLDLYVSVPSKSNDGRKRTTYDRHQHTTSFSSDNGDFVRQQFDYKWYDSIDTVFIRREWTEVEEELKTV
jgi:hypothetical protein